MAAQPGSDMPSASAMAFMVDAVPMVLQWPTEGADEVAMSMNSLKSILPAATSWRACHSTVPEPASSPLWYPSSIGPPDSTIAGVLTVAAAIKQAGVVLSQPVISTTPSSG